MPYGPLRATRVRLLCRVPFGWRKQGPRKPAATARSVSAGRTGHPATGPDSHGNPQANELSEGIALSRKKRSDTPMVGVKVSFVASFA